MSDHDTFKRALPECPYCGKFRWPLCRGPAVTIPDVREPQGKPVPVEPDLDASINEPPFFKE